MENSIIKEQKQKGLVSKFLGFFISMCLTALLLLRYFNFIVDDFIFVMLLLAFSGVLFCFSASVAQTRASRAWIILNIILSLIFLLASCVLLVYGLVSKQLILF